MLVQPPNAHHCRVCNVCIIKKDHHCVFLNNCVAVGNMRSESGRALVVLALIISEDTLFLPLCAGFLLFLLFTFASIIFCGFHMVLSIVLERSALIASLSKAWAMSKGPRIFLIHINLFLSLKWTLVVAIINLSFSCSILVGVGTLLWFQFVSLSSLPPLDSTATDGKEGQAAGAKPAWSNVIAHLSLIIRGRGGQKSLLLWIWPIWSPNHHESADRLSVMKPKATWCSVDDSLLNSGAIANNKME